MNLKILEKYKSVINMRDFDEVKELLKVNNIEPLKYIDNSIDGYNGSAHSILLKKFLGINEKNNIKNLEYLFTNKIIKKDFYTSFPIKNIESDYPDEEQVHIILPCIKSRRNLDMMIEPLLQVLDMNKKSIYGLILTNSENQKMRLTSYFYEDVNNKTLTIYEPDNYLKNTFYGLLNYINIDKWSFFQKELVLYNINEIIIEKEELTKIKRLFEILSFSKYRYELIVRYEYEDKLYLVDISFFEDKSERCILKCENLEIDFFKSFFETYYDLKYILDEMVEKEKRISFFYKKEYLTININNYYINLELDKYLIRDFFNDIFDDVSFSLLNKIKFYLKGFDFPYIITKSYYNNTNNRLLVKYKIRSIF